MVYKRADVRMMQIQLSGMNWLVTVFFFIIKFKIKRRRRKKDRKEIGTHKMIYSDVVTSVSTKSLHSNEMGKGARKALP